MAMNTTVEKTYTITLDEEGSKDLHKILCWVEAAMEERIAEVTPELKAAARRIQQEITFKLEM